MNHSPLQRLLVFYQVYISILKIRYYIQKRTITISLRQRNHGKWLSARRMMGKGKLEKPLPNNVFNMAMNNGCSFKGCWTKNFISLHLWKHSAHNIFPCSLASRNGLDDDNLLLIFNIPSSIIHHHIKMSSIPSVKSGVNFKTQYE